MVEIFKDFNIDITKKQQDKLFEFMEILLFYNKFFNITSVTNKDEFIIKHLVDSIAGMYFFKSDGLVCEIGSGGGFPSIPLKIVREDLNFTLVESTYKKCKFLNEVIDKLQLQNIVVINNRAENLGKDKNFRQKFDFVCARAVAKLNTLLEYCVPLLKVGGNFIAYKTLNEEELESSKSAQSLLGVEVENIYNYLLPINMGERSIIVFKKIKDTPLIYPRGNGKERKCPL